MRKHHYITLILAFLFYCAPKAIAQAPGIAWQKTLGGPGTDVALNVQQTLDGGYVVVGTREEVTTTGTGREASNVIVTKFSATGTVLWYKFYGGTNNDYGYAIRNTIDGGFIVAASSNSSDHDVSANMGGFDVWILKLSATGDIEWQTITGGSGNESAYDIRQTADTGYVFVGRTSSANGHITENKGGYDMWVAKLNKTGAMQWQHTYGGSADDNLMSIIPTSDGGYMVAGDTYSSGGDITESYGFEDMWVAKLNATGAIQWQHCYGGANADYAQSIRATTDGAYIVAGGSNSTNGHITSNIGGGDVWLLKLTATGNIVWQRSYGSTSDDAANSIEVTSDGGFIVSGWVGGGNNHVSGFVGLRDHWVLKLSSAADIQWQKCLNDDPFNEANCAIQATSGDYVVAGRTASFGSGASNGWVVALSHSVAGVEQTTTVMPRVAIYPNPTTGQLFLQGIINADITVSNMLSAILVEAHDTDHIDISGLPAAMYMVTVSGKDGSLIDRFKVSKL